LKGVERDFNEVIRAVKLAANREEAAPDD
jgi:hypothetical protein